MNIHPLRGVLAAVLATTLILAGCGASDDTSSTPGTTAPSATAGSRPSTRREPSR